jgi:hypothetical protein
MAWIAVGIAFLILGGIALLIYQGRSEYSKKSTALATINSIPLELAQKQALSLLQDASVFRYVKARDQDEKALASLPDTLRRFLSQYERAESCSAAGAYVDRNIIGPSKRQPQYILIGHGMEGTDLEYELCVLRSDDRIFELAGADAPDPAFGTYATIFHWVIAVAKEERAA